MLSRFRPLTPSWAHYRLNCRRRTSCMQTQQPPALFKGRGSSHPKPPENPTHVLDWSWYPRQVPVDATTNISELCSLINVAFTDPVVVTARSGGRRVPLPPIPSIVRLSAVNKMAKSNLVLIRGPQVTP